jgi:mono/diheme cytochrome c family protein
MSPTRLQHFGPLLAACVLAMTVSGIARVSAQTPSPSSTPPSLALPSPRTGEDIYRATCAACHGLDGKGQPRSVVGYDTPLPDFTDCSFATAEPDPDWQAVVHEGGRIRGLSRRMPSFGDALSKDDIASAVGYVRSFCTSRKWPQGDLNFPRAFFTEKAFPENEAVWTTSVAGGDEKSVGNTLVYERRFGARTQMEAVVPLNFQQTSAGAAWSQGLGDIAFAVKHAFYSSMKTGRIAAAGAEVALPTGNESTGLGNGFTVFEPFAMWGQILPKNSFLQMHGGAEFPSDSTKGSKELYLRTALGTTFAANRGFGRAWTPQVEVLWARPAGGSSEWDVVPQLQVSLSKLQHVLVAGGVRIPVNGRGERHPEALVYLLWDWFDGGFFEFWK